MQLGAPILRHAFLAPYWRRLAAVLAGGLLATAASGGILYWDTNGNTAGAGATPTGTWATSGGTNKNWSASSSGGGTVVWTSGSDAVFSAGTDAINAYTVTLAATQNVISRILWEGLTCGATDQCCADTGDPLSDGKCVTTESSGFYGGIY